MFHFLHAAAFKKGSRASLMAAAETGGPAGLQDGVFPTMITPFLDDGCIDWRRVDALTEWYIANGCAGIFAVCQSSEMYHLSNSEKLSLARRVYEKAAGRVPIVASGTFHGSIEDKAAFVLEMGAIVDVVVVLVNQMCGEGESNEVWKANVQQLLDQTGSTPLGLYECPVPYHRCLDPATLRWCAETQRFLFHKDTCRNRGGISAKMHALAGLATPFRFYNGNLATLKHSLDLGCSGFSGVCANLYPQLVVWLVAHHSHEFARAVHDWLAVAENTVQTKYPLSAKVFLAMFDCFKGTPYCRSTVAALTEEEHTRLLCLHRMAAALCLQLGLPSIPPTASDP